MQHSAAAGATNACVLSLQVDTDEQLEDEEVEWDTQWVNDETGASQEVEWFVEDDDKDTADEVCLLCMTHPRAHPFTMYQQHMDSMLCLHGTSGLMETRHFGTDSEAVACGAWNGPNCRQSFAPSDAAEVYLEVLCTSTG